MSMHPAETETWGCCLSLLGTETQHQFPQRREGGHEERTPRRDPAGGGERKNQLKQLGAW